MHTRRVIFVIIIIILDFIYGCGVLDSSIWGAPKL